ncbi:MAG: type II toxin-antitoxin system HipA family toxin YjjJ [Candidatus Synoicihabitans palmerolidicus]|nr:type II toxin-antitoxin system HipA family toxin YjjJ [Candidatus Synoicihabitans palmerolidicus]
MLQASGPLTARGLMEREGVAQPTVSRRLGELGERVVALGSARRTQYALRRRLQHEDRWTIYRINEQGRARAWAVLHALCGGWKVEWLGSPPEWEHAAGVVDGFGEGFPFFLGDVRSQGFLGRARARGSVAQSLGLPPDPRLWSDDDILRYQVVDGENLSGNLLVGDGNWQNHFQFTQTDGLPIPRGINELSRLVDDVLSGGILGSSAGGEQPKLAVYYHTEPEPSHALIKFSPPLGNPVGRRWADLLSAEAHATQVLAEANGDNCSVQVRDVEQRRFLIVPRFDRVGVHGRRGVVSLEALAGTFGDAARPDWVSRGEFLHRAGLVNTAGLETVRKLACFGALIGNTDMHAGNLGFWFDDSLPFIPAPVYDMLPMRWAPTAQGELRDVDFVPTPPLPALEPAWRKAVVWAVTFWRLVAADETTVSPEFRVIAGRALAIVERLQQRLN